LIPLRLAAAECALAAPEEPSTADAAARGRAYAVEKNCRGCPRRRLCGAGSTNRRALEWRPLSLLGRTRLGVERWKVKTLQDRPRLLRAHAIPMSQLVSHDRPTPLPGTRLPFERHIWSVDAAVTLVRHEPDEDFHIVLESGADQMIAESPSPACTRGGTAYRRRQMREVRMKLRLCSQARVVGVAFFDFKHGQTGVAPNAIELHAILDFACLVGPGGEPNAH
jgi:hypothetical protein